jgi:hypothetical protein
MLHRSICERGRRMIVGCVTAYSFVQGGAFVVTY